MQETPLAPGLYLVATPIGNLEDITFRALRVLRSVDRIACEDTRQTQKLLNHFEITTPTLSLYEHNEADRSAKIVAELKEGARIAVVSDAGMPGICDPGMFLTKAAIEAGIAVYPIPGANAALSALVASGLNTEHFLFAGFLPPKPGARRTQLEQMQAAITGEQTLLFYEAPHRIAETLEDIEHVWGPACSIVVARELTKLHEEFLRGPVKEVREELLSRERIRGEIVLLVEAKPASPSGQNTELSLTDRIAELTRTENLGEMDALKRIAKERSVSKSELYRELQRLRPASGRKG